MRQRVQAARAVQRQRFRNSDIACNTEMRPAEVRRFCSLDETGNALLRTAMARFQLSARAYHRTLKLAWTIADLANSEHIAPEHLAKALQYRPRMLLL